ncbi:unnamed protein product [Moneuplotes crassus]|uniref:C2H2-type domain-containing protein n=1 Tax=Euplotes crassus TaxID=5936 RepID=A0AAD1XQX0_EUPCR|nr:unnamed protein product [Moneuplotes crassus]
MQVNIASCFPKLEELMSSQELTLKIIARDYCFCDQDMLSFLPSQNERSEIKIGSSSSISTNDETQGSTESKKKHKQLRSINYSVLEGHPYEIIDNPKTSEKNRKLYICKYSNCGKVFKKTWNLVYHFRVHEKEAAYECKYCGKTFIQKANYERHMSVHDHTPMEQRKKHDCPHCARKYSCKYNLNAHIKRDHKEFAPKIQRRRKARN